VRERGGGRGGYGQAELLVLEAIRRSAESAGLADGLAPPVSWPDAVPGSRLTRGLAEWVRSCPRPLVLFFDEIDALRGESLRSVLRQFPLCQPWVRRPASAG
jgi:hypothetical protein